MAMSTTLGWAFNESVKPSKLFGSFINRKTVFRLKNEIRVILDAVRTSKVDVSEISYDSLKHLFAAINIAYGVPEDRSYSFRYYIPRDMVSAIETVEKIEAISAVPQKKFMKECFQTLSKMQNLFDTLPANYEDNTESIEFRVWSNKFATERNNLLDIRRQAEIKAEDMVQKAIQEAYESSNPYRDKPVDRIIRRLF